MWGDDNVTGNGAYYYDTEERCLEYVGTNLALYFEAAREFDDFPTSKSPWVEYSPARHMDCTIRCYLLRECIETYLDKKEEEK